MLNQTQIQWVKERLAETGQISRNECLQKYITRLGAIICDLRKEGYVFEAKFVKTFNGKDSVSVGSINKHSGIKVGK